MDLSDEEVDDEDEGEDLDEMEEMDDLELEDEDLCDEQSDLGSFLADEEPNQLEDSSEYSDEDGQEEEEANGAFWVYLGVGTRFYIQPIPFRASRT